MKLLWQETQSITLPPLLNPLRLVQPRCSEHHTDSQYQPLEQSYEQPLFWFFLEDFKILLHMDFTTCWDCQIVNWQKDTFRPIKREPRFEQIDFVGISPFFREYHTVIASLRIWGLIHSVHIKKDLPVFCIKTVSEFDTLLTTYECFPKSALETILSRKCIWHHNTWLWWEH